MMWPVRAEDRAGQLPEDRRRGLRSLHAVALALLVVLLAVTAGVAVATRTLVADQESRLLRERATEIDLVLSTTVTSISDQLAGLTHVARIDPSQFAAEARATGGSTSATQTWAVLRQAAGGAWEVVDHAGPGLHDGQVLTGEQAGAAARAEASGNLTATPIIGSGSTRSLGLARPAAPGVVVYRLAALGPVRAPAQASTAPFSDLRVVLWAAPRPEPGQVVVATTSDTVLDRDARYLPLRVGASTWLVGVETRTPLVGTVAHFAPWAVVLAGLAGSLLVFLLVNSVLRRRDEVVARYRAEHDFAEALQRRLLPAIPALAGLDVSSRYVAASDGQQVGGDWFDVFPLPSDCAAVVIGDVMGHDVEAAAAMSQLRSALRAYALEGGSPASVLERLDRMADRVGLVPLATVVYGVIGPAGPDGSRALEWANAGHLPPLVRRPGGRVEGLAGGSSPLIGAPGPHTRSEASTVLEPGSTLLLYTDGLVETRGGDLTDAIRRLEDAVASEPDGSTEDLCEAVLASHIGDDRRDDIALMAVRVQPARTPTPSLDPAPISTSAPGRG